MSAVDELYAAHAVTNVSLRHAEQLDAANAEIERLRTSLGHSDQALAAQVAKCCEYVVKLDAVAIALGLPVESHHIAGCDVLAHYVRDTVENSRKVFAEIERLRAANVVLAADAVRESERLRAELAACRDAALEKAAKVCEQDSVSDVITGAYLAEEIRALKREGGGNG